LDAALIGGLSRLQKKPVVLTYHCDLQLPRGLIHWIANQGSHVANHISALAAQAIVTNTQDYANHSSFLKHYLRKVRIIPPPVTLPAIDEADVAAFREKYALRPGERLIGMAARLASEKGVEYLVQALPKVIQRFPDARVLFVGQNQKVMGEEAYAARLLPRIQELGSHWTFLGILDPKELAVFFNECAVTVLPSINGTESFGMVQIESMSCGTPVVATDLPGIRQPVLISGMGRIVPPRSSADLAAALIELLSDPAKNLQIASRIAEQYSPARVAQQYEQILEELRSA
jgi:glycosyltransferase involved in cell wall biosynthesis